MIYRFSLVSLAAVLIAGSVACTKSNPAQPSGTAGTASVAAPRGAQPGDTAQIPNASQPVTLVVQNAVVTQTGSTTYTFEVATDSAFSAKVQTKDAVAEGSSGQTSVTLDALAAAKDYYWHARAQSGGTTGVYGPTYKFTIGAAVLINAPTPVSPLTGSGTTTRPTLLVANAIHTGPVVAITYKFEIAASAAFSPVVVTGTVSEGSGQTSFAPGSDLAPNQTYFWRATASDAASGVSSAASTAQSFTTSPNTQQSNIAAALGVALWSGAQPTGTNGHATLGDGWGIQNVVSFTGVGFVSPTIDELQIFDLLDRGFAPQDAIDWMHGHGYSTPAAWFPGVGPGDGVIGFQFAYMTQIDGHWDLVQRVGA